MRRSTIRGLATAAAATLLALSVTPSPVMGQSDVAFPSSAYAARRARLAAQTGDAAVIVPGAYLIGAEDLFRQDPDFWYLTGVESPYSVLVMTKRAGEVHTTLFLPDKYQFAGAQYPMADEGVPPRGLEPAGRPAGAGEGRRPGDGRDRNVSARGARHAPS